MTNETLWPDTDDIKLYSSGTITDNYLPKMVMDGFQMNDVTKQPHYMNLKIQPLMVMLNDLSKDEFKGYLKGNVIKYILRAERKNGSEDYAKAAFYAKLLEDSLDRDKLAIKKEINALEAQKNALQRLRDNSLNERMKVLESFVSRRATETDIRGWFESRTDKLKECGFSTPKEATEWVKRKMAG